MRTALALLLVLGTAACHTDALERGEDHDGGADLRGVDVDLGGAPGDPPLDPTSFPDVGDRCGGGTRAIVDACGDAAACRIQHDEVLPAAIGWNDGPVIILDGDQPLVFVPIGDMETGGQLLRRGGDGSWAVSSTARGMLGALARGGGHVARIDYDGAFGTTYEDGGGWTAGERLPAQYISRGGALAVDDAGCAYVALTMSDRDRMRLARRADAWSYAQPFGTDQVERPQVALAADGSVEVVGWRVQDAGWVLSWAHLPDAAEAVQPSIGNVLSEQTLRFDVSGATPHLMWNDGTSLYYATRGAGGWTQGTIASGTAGTGCESTPTAPGQTCDAHVTQVEPIAVLADGASTVRLVWTRLDQVQHLTASCQMSGPGPTPSCTWVGAGQTSTAALYVASPVEAATATGMTLSHGLDRPSAALADDGTVHVVGYDDTGVRYLVIGR